MKPVLIVNNSFCELRGFSSETEMFVDELLTYQNDIEAERAYLIKQIRFLKDLAARPGSGQPKARQKLGFAKKQFKDLLATEYVRWFRDGKFPTGHLPMVKSALEITEPKYEVRDLRVRPAKRYDFILAEDLPAPRYYQEEMHQIGLKAHRGVFESAVGSGKSQVAMRLIAELGVTTLFVVPGKPLLKQMLNSLVKHFGRRNVIALNSQSTSSKSQIRKFKRTPIRIINIQSMAAMMKRGDLHLLLDDVDAIFIDEFHHMGSATGTSLLPYLDHIYFRYGFSGTFMRNDSKTLDMHGVLSEKLYSYPARQAIRDGFLTPVRVIEHVLPGAPKNRYESEYRANYCGDEKRKPAALLTAIQSIFENHVGGKDQVLILVNRTDQCGDIIHQFLNQQHIENTYVSGDSEDDVIDSAIRDFNEKRIRVLIGSPVLGEGVDLISSDHLILSSGGKSEIAIVQSAGRLVRLCPGKKLGYLHDFNFEGTKFLSKHWSMRRDIYARNLDPEFETESHA